MSQDVSTPSVRGVGNGPVAGRFVLLHGSKDEPYYITSWDTWEECEVAFPIENDAWLFDQDTGRKWDRHSKYEWEAAAT